jgi:hypothetical protein
MCNSEKLLQAHRQSLWEVPYIQAWWRQWFGMWKERVGKFITYMWHSYQGHNKISSSTAYTQLSLSMAALVGPLCGKRETHIHDISNTYVPFQQLFAKEKSLKSEGIGMHREKIRVYMAIA